MQDKPIYLDYNATTPLDPKVIEAMKPYLEEYFGNPSSTHWYGIQTKKAVEHARRQVAGLLNCKPEEIVFTSGGSESNNYAIKGIAYANREKGTHIITSAIEHPAVYEVCRYLESHGFLVTYLPVDDTGLIHVDELERAIRPDTILITIMHANNEVGTIQPIDEIAALAKSRDIFVHTDAAQSVGKIPTNVQELGVDLLSIAGHKLYAPKGIGALYLKQNIKLEKFVHGADHERNFRAGTENVLEIVGLGEACDIARSDMKKHIEHMRFMRDRLHEQLRSAFPDMRMNGHPENRLPNTLSISFPNMEANTVLDALNDVAASAGAACHSDSIDISPTLSAMKVPEHFAMGTIRFSTGRFTTEDEIDRASEAIKRVVNSLKPREPIEPPASLDVEDIRLTSFTHGLGCACKLRPQALEKVLADLPVPNDANVIVGLGTADDAAVYRLDDNTAIVQTVDFFTPIVDDPYHFGAISAANSLSDVYAMGGKPLFALNIVGFPSNRLPMEILKKILKGAQDKADEAGISIVGGHTVDDTEPKFGLAVTGIVHPHRILTNSGAKDGDILILTKPLGLGILTTAIKRGMADNETVEDAIRVMSTLNRTAAEIMTEFEVNACTDITGFGLLGHLKEMIITSGTHAVIDSSAVPIMNNARDFVVANIVPGGTLNNLDFVSEVVDWSDDVSQVSRILLCDAQTSGGLLISIPENDGEGLVKTLCSNGVDAAIIGRITAQPSGKISVS